MARLKIIPAVKLVERLFQIKNNDGLTQVFNEAGYDQTNMAHILAYFCSTMIGLIVILFVVLVGSLLINWLLKRHTGLPKRAFWQSSHRLLLLGLIELILCPIIYILGKKILWFSILLACMCAIFVIYLLVRLIDVLCVRRS